MGGPSCIQQKRGFWIQGWQTPCFSKGFPNPPGSLTQARTSQQVVKNKGWQILNADFQRLKTSPQKSMICHVDGQKKKQNNWCSLFFIFPLMRSLFEWRWIMPNGDMVGLLCVNSITEQVMWINHQWIVNDTRACEVQWHRRSHHHYDNCKCRRHHQVSYYYLRLFATTTMSDCLHVC